MRYAYKGFAYLGHAYKGFAYKGFGAAATNAAVSAGIPAATGAAATGAAATNAAVSAGIPAATRALSKGPGWMRTIGRSAAIGGIIGGVKGALSGDQTMIGGALQGAQYGALFGGIGRAATGRYAGSKFGMTKVPSLRGVIDRKTFGGASYINTKYPSEIAKASRGYGLSINARGIVGQRIGSNNRTVIAGRTSTIAGLAAGLFGSSNRSKNSATINANRMGGGLNHMNMALGR